MPLGMAATKIGLCLLGLISVAGASEAQTTGKTVRHRRVAEKSAVSDTVAAAEAAMDKKDYATAETLLNQAVAAAPDDYRAWFDLGFVFKATARQPQAIEAYRKSVAAKPDVFESNLNLGLLLASAGNSEAEKYLRAATQLKPSAQQDAGLERAWISLGRVIEKSQPQPAIAAFREAARLEPQDPEPHLSLGLLLEGQNNFAAAEKEYQQAATLDPKSSEALAGLVNVYSRQKRLAEAESALRKYIAMQTAAPQKGQAHLQLGRVLAAQNRPQEALAELETGRKLAPDDPTALREMAELYVAAGNYAQAEAAYKLLLDRNPNDAGQRYELGKVLLNQRKFADAQRELLNAVKIKPSLGEAYGQLAIAASENQDFPLAIKALDARASFLPENPATYFLRATAYDHLKAFKQASENYRQFLLASNGKNPDQEWKARHRLIAIEPRK